MDGNQQVLPLAFAVVDEETYPSWKWFLQQLSRHVIRGRRGCALFLTVMADSLKQFVKVRTLCHHMECTEYQLRKFNRIMDEIKKQDVKAFAYLDAINKEKWTASHDGGWRCGILTTNMSECINGVLKGARRLPVSALVEITLERAKVDMNTHVVKIDNRECSCGKWNQFGIPCSHAQKVCGAYNNSAASMVKDYYDVMAYNNTYSKHFEPVQSEDYWDDPNSSWSTTLLSVRSHVLVEIKQHAFIMRWIGGKREQGKKPNNNKEILQYKKMCYRK
ncbi:UNVERIFIED_CONTAM: hypothetical protein Sangu_2538500 [Sesamum angustifolium]|uniref:SWIM-type domain-containing protein n=1 Tax=Sesamum angustifolium TaxID=2727405 RepID=A0AAW2JCI3_9LAMI